MKLKFFGELRLKVGKEVGVKLEREVSFDELIEMLKNKFPHAKEEFDAIEFYIVSVNGRIVKKDELEKITLSDDDEVIFMPSIAGGSIKTMISKNFDASVTNYDDFERKYGFFERLARDLVEFSGVKGFCLDVGCGTGILGKVMKNVVGLDVSKEMVRKARGLIEDVVVGDASNLPFKDSRFDSVVFNATIFLIPDAERSLDEALRVVREGGIVAGSYLIGFFDGREDALKKLGLKHRVVFDRVKLEELLKGYGAERGEAVYLFDREAVLDFYSIPAMANALFPKVKSFDEKVRLARERLRGLPERVEFRWGFFRIVK